MVDPRTVVGMVRNERVTLEDVFEMDVCGPIRQDRLDCTDDYFQRTPPYSGPTEVEVPNIFDTVPRGIAAFVREPEHRRPNRAGGCDAPPSSFQRHSQRERANRRNASNAVFPVGYRRSPFARIRPTWQSPNTPSRHIGCTIPFAGAPGAAGCLCKDRAPADAGLQASDRALGPV